MYKNLQLTKEKQMQSVYNTRSVTSIDKLNWKYLSIAKSIFA